MDWRGSAVSAGAIPYARSAPASRSRFRLHALSIACPLGRDFFGRVRRSVFVEGGPAALSIGRAAGCGIHRFVALQELADCRCACIIHTGRNESAATAHAFCIEVSISFGDAFF